MNVIGTFKLGLSERMSLLITNKYIYFKERIKFTKYFNKIFSTVMIKKIHCVYVSELMSRAQSQEWSAALL